jgi:hypothetical protein
MRPRLRPTHVFINCPFDSSYKPVFDAIVFAVLYLGFVARSALESDDGGDIRIKKIERIIEQCRYGIHDISAAGLDPHTDLARFNMPFELGLFLGCERFGDARQRQKSCLILDTKPYRFRIFISDIAGQEVKAHGRNPERAIAGVRDWLASRRKGLPGGTSVAKRYRKFLRALPGLCKEADREMDKLTFPDFVEMIEAWLDAGR